MSPFFLVIADLVFQTTVVQDDHVVEEVATYTSNPTLRDAVLPDFEMPFGQVLRRSV